MSLVNTLRDFPGIMLPTPAKIVGGNIGRIGENICLELSYSKRPDPYGMFVTVVTKNEAERVAWPVERKLFSDGLLTAMGAKPLGHGDFRIGTSKSSPDLTEIILDSPDGTVVIEAYRKELQQFIDVTNIIVPPGKEWQYVDLEGELLPLLRKRES